MPRETDVLRLDYSKAPPGYVVEEIPADERHAPDLVWRARCNCASAERTTPEEAMAASWVHYKNRNAPPGMWAEALTTQWLWGTGQGAVRVTVGVDAEKHPARAAAWAWYDRRHALSLRDEARVGFPIFTMAGYLALTDAQCDHAEMAAALLDGGAA